MNTLRNRVQLIGNLGMKPEIKTIGNNRKMAVLKIATNESYRDTSGKKVENTQWHTVIAWGNVADIAERFLEKGIEIAIEGKLVHRNYDDKTGNKRFVTEIVANEMVMLSKRKTRE